MIVRLYTFCAFYAFYAFCALCSFYAFCVFAWLRLCAFYAFCACKIFSEKKWRSSKLLWWLHLHYYSFPIFPPPFPTFPHRFPTFLPFPLPAPSFHFPISHSGFYRLRYVLYVICKYYKCCKELLHIAYFDQSATFAFSYFYFMLVCLSTSFLNHKRCI